MFRIPAVVRASGVAMTFAGLCACASLPREEHPSADTASRSDRDCDQAPVRAQLSMLESHVFRPSEPSTQTYAEVAKPIDLGPMSWVVDELHRVGVVHDPGLSKVVHSLAQALPVPATDMPPRLVEGLMAWYGRVGPMPQLLIQDHSGQGMRCQSADCKAELAPLIEAARRRARSEESLVFGLARVPIRDGHGQRFVLGISEETVKLEPMTRSFSEGQRLRLRGRLSGRRTAPRILVVGASGEGRELRAVLGDDQSFASQIVCDSGSGVYQVEIVANGRFGPEVVANFPLHCDVPIPDSVEYELERLTPNASHGDLEKLTVDLINEARRAHGIAPVQWSDAVASVARAHSRDMEHQDFVGHVSPKTGSTRDRLQAAGIEVPVALENVAAGYGPYGVQESLMASPGHRANILNPQVTHVGVGIALRTTLGEPPTVSMFLTQNFVRFERKPAVKLPELEPAALLREINLQRTQRGEAALILDPVLSELASLEVEQWISKGVTSSADELARRIQAGGWRAVDRYLASVNDPAGLSHWRVWNELQSGPIGVAWAQDSSKDATIVVLLAVRAPDS